MPYGGNPMKNFKRENLLFSLCGLNCGLCPMNLNQYCPGCGGGDGNQSCSIAKCSFQHGNVEYCFQCENYPCERYENIDEFDSFITHQRQKQDMEKFKELGIEFYHVLCCSQFIGMGRLGKYHKCSG